MATRRVALVGVITGERRVAQTGGHPLDPEEMLPMADVLLLVESTPGAMLFRYTAYGELGGDTWHATVAEAVKQAEFEYAEALLPWIDVPDDITDAHAFAIAYAGDRLNERG